MVPAAIHNPRSAIYNRIVGATEGWKLTPPKEAAEAGKASNGRSHTWFLLLSVGSLLLQALSYSLLFSFFWIFGLLFIILIAPVSMASGIAGVVWIVDRRGLKSIPRILMLTVHAGAILAPIALFLQMGRFKFD